MSLTKRREEMAQTGYGASEVGVLAGLNPYTSPIKLFEKRVYGLPEQETSLPAELGSLLEEPLAKKFAADTGLHLVKSATLRHRVHTYGLCIATPDRIAFVERRATKAQVNDPVECDAACANVQIKTASMWSRREWGEPGTDGIPQSYLAQVQWEMAATGLKKTFIPVLFDKAEYAVFEVGFDEELFGRLYEIVERFHVDHVLAKVPPPIDASDNYRDFLFNRFGDGLAKKYREVEPGSFAETKVLRYRELKTIEKETAEELKKLGYMLRGAIGDDKGLSGSFGQVSWGRAPGKPVTDWEALAKAVVNDPAKLSEFTKLHQKIGPAYDQLRTRWAKNDTNEEEG